MTSAPRSRLSLRQNFTWVLLGSIVENAAKWAMLVILAKLSAPEVVGAFSYALAVVTPFSILAQLQLRVALITDSDSEHSFAAYWSLRLVCTLLFVIALAMVELVDRGPDATTMLVLVVGAGQAIMNLRDIWAALAQKHEHMDVTAWGNSLSGCLSLAFFALGMLLTRSLVWAASGIILANLITLVVYDIPAARRVAGEDAEDARIWPSWHPGTMLRLFWVALPLGVTTALVSVNSNIPRYLIEHYLGKAELGYFAALAYLVFAAQLVIGALSRAASPRLAILYRRDRRRYGVVLAKLLAIGAALAVVGVAGAWLVGEHVLRIAYSAEYAQQNHILIMLMIAGGVLFINSFLGTAISAARYFAVQSATYVVVGLTTLLAGFLLIPRYGLEGAAWAAIIAAGAVTILNAGVVVYVYRRPAPGPIPG